MSETAKQTNRRVIKEFALRENETVLKVVRHAPSVLFPHIAACFLILILDFFLMYYLFLQGWWGVWLFGSVMAIVLFYVLRVLFLFSANRFIITDRRIVDIEQTGLLEKFINEFPYAKISQAKAIIKGLGPTIFHYGDLRLSLRDDLGQYELFKVPAPIELQELINTRLEATAAGRATGIDPVALIMAEVRLLTRVDKEEVMRQLETELAEDEARGNMERSVI